MTSRHTPKSACASPYVVPRNGPVIVNCARRSPQRNGMPRKSRWNETPSPNSPLNCIARRCKCGVSPINYHHNNRSDGDVSPLECFTAGPLGPRAWTKSPGARLWMTLRPMKKPIGPGPCDGCFDICACVPGRRPMICNVCTVPWVLVLCLWCAWGGNPFCGNDVSLSSRPIPKIFQISYLFYSP